MRRLFKAAELTGILAAVGSAVWAAFTLLFDEQYTAAEDPSDPVGVIVLAVFGVIFGALLMAAGRIGRSFCRPEVSQ